MNKPDVGAIHSEDSNRSGVAIIASKRRCCFGTGHKKAFVAKKK